MSLCCGPSACLAYVPAIIWRTVNVLIGIVSALYAIIAAAMTAWQLADSGSEENGDKGAFSFGSTVFTLILYAVLFGAAIALILGVVWIKAGSMSSQEPQDWISWTTHVREFDLAILVARMKTNLRGGYFVKTPVSGGTDAEDAVARFKLSKAMSGRFLPKYC
ncbi:unnamed protein product [Cyprideis torosa]|uniref:Uncharacterized protein n=1 Tax=Cyprideis torosa TaxID=163714 RepID=A0A7R8W7Q2_9CRUS|nr:unnamed protein product [Cyprideis torosa]CAG0887798.1 unnamed protein product [Cyprideis torosa]